MVFLIILMIFFYTIIGGILGGLYYYLNRSRFYCDDLEDMAYLPIWIAIFWPLVSPISFAIYYAKVKIEEDDDDL